MMKKGTKIWGLMVILLIIGHVFGGLVSAEDISELWGPKTEIAWPMFQHDPQHTGRSPYVGPQTPNIKWIFDGVREAIHGPSVADDGTIYLAASKLYAISPEGKLKWQHQAGGVNAPVVRDGMVYVVAHGGLAHDGLSAFDSEGILKWNKTLARIYMAVNPTLGSNEKLYYVAGCVLPDGLIHCCLIALDLNGEVEWIYDAEEGKTYEKPDFDLAPNGCQGGVDPGPACSPSIGPDGTIYFGWEQTLIAIYPDGQEKWRKFFDVWSGHTVGTPTISPEGRIYTSVDRVYAIDPNNQTLWSFNGGYGNRLSPALSSDGTLYVLAARIEWPGIARPYLSALDSHGNLKWEIRLDSSGYRSSPTVDSDGTVYIVDWGTLRAFDSQGNEKWNLNLNWDVHLPRSFSIGSGGTLYVPAGDKLYAIGPTIQKPPIASFTYTPKNPLVNQLITFNASNSTAEGTIVKYDWGFGDGNTATGKIVTHSYPSAGTYTVNLTVTDDRGAKDRINKTLNIGIGEYNPKLTVPVYTPTFQQAHKGTSVTYIIRVSNEGAAKDTIKLSLPGDLEWDPHLSETSVTLAPGESTDVYLYLTVQSGTNRITITGTSQGDISKNSYCMVTAKDIGEGHGLFAVSLFFKNNDTRDHKLNFNAPDYVKISNKTITLSPSEGKWINVVFDPKSSISFWFNIDVADVTTGESAKIPVEFPEYDIIATNFDMARDSYSFKNPIGLFCYGMSETSVLYFKDEIPLPFKRQNTYSLSKFEAMPNIFSHQRFFKESFFASLFQKFFYVDEAEEYDYLAENIVYDCPMILGLQDPGVLGEAHAVVVYKIILDPDADKAYIFIYDNEVPYDMSSNSFFDAFPYAVYNMSSQKFTFGTYNKFLALDAKKLPLENIPVVLILACPVNITLIDQYGRIISDNGTNEIPGAGMIILNKTKRFYLPTNLTYSAKIDAYDAGLFNFTRVSPVGNNFSLTAFENISVTASTKAFVEIKPNVTNYTMKIDYNGDGHFDEEKNPDVTEMIEVNQPPIADANGPYAGVIEYIAVPITFDGTGSYDPDGTIIKYAWDLDNDGKFDDAVGATPTVSFTAPYSGNIHLKVTDNNGATDTDTTTLTITKYSPPPNGIHDGLIMPPEQPQCYRGTSTIQGKGNFFIDESIQDWATAIDTSEHIEGTGEFEMTSKRVLNQAANTSDFYDPNFYYKKTMQFQGNATNRLISRDKFESSGIFGGTGTRINEFFDVSMIQKEESGSIKTISAPGSGQSHRFATMDDFSGIWGIHSGWQKICQKDIRHHQMFIGNFSVQKDLTFEREIVIP